MKNIIFRNFSTTDAEPITTLQELCIKECHDTGILKKGFWLSPFFKNGKNIHIATNLAGEVLAYAAICPSYYSRTLDAHILWIDIRVNPNTENFIQLKNILLEWLINRGHEIKDEENIPHAAIGATYFENGKASIEFLSNREFSHFETILAMRKDLSLAIPSLRTPKRVEIQQWQMESQTEQEIFLSTQKDAFGYQSWDLPSLQHFLKSNLWKGGTTYAAFCNQQLISCVMVLSNGLIDTVFTIPAWRRNGIAKVLFSKILGYLKENNHSFAWLELLSSNLATMSLYQSLGFEVFKKEISLGYMLD